MLPCCPGVALEFQSLGKITTAWEMQPLNKVTTAHKKQQHEQAAHLAFTTRLITAALCDAGSPCHPHPACLAHVQGGQADQEAKVGEGSRRCCQVSQARGGLFSCHSGQRSCRPHRQDWRHSAYTVYPQESCKPPDLACMCRVTLFTHATCFAGAVAKSACLIRSTRSRSTFSKVEYAPRPPRVCKGTC